MSYEPLEYLADQITAQIQKEDEMVFLLMEFA